jgi:hypothetical protein
MLDIALALIYTNIISNTPTSPGYGAAIMGGKYNGQEYIFNGKG